MLILRNIDKKEGYMGLIYPTSFSPNYFTVFLLLCGKLFYVDSKD